MIYVVTRRSFICGGATMFAFGQTRMPVRDVFDHLLLGVSDLDHGIDWFESRTGVRAIVGGVHPGRGTRNALVSLGGTHYLEIIAPDPAQSATDRQRHLSMLTEPRLINFAVRTHDITGTAASLQRAGVHVIGPEKGRGGRPPEHCCIGRPLKWRVSSTQARLIRFRSLLSGRATLLIPRRALQPAV